MKKMKFGEQEMGMEAVEYILKTLTQELGIGKQRSLGENSQKGAEEGINESLNTTQPQVRLSYKESLVGIFNTPTSMEHEKEEYLDSDDNVYVTKNDKEDCPIICLTKKEKKLLRQRWRQSLIVKVWGRTVGYNFMLKNLQNMWKPKAFMDLVSLENDYFLVRFYSEIDYAFARDEGPWTILDHYLVVKEWTPNFDLVIDKTKKLIVWVRFPCLPIEYFDFALLKKVGEKIGRPIRVDHNTGTASRGKFARL